MFGKSRLPLTQHFKVVQNVVNEYDSKRIANIIRRYQEMRCAAEITAAQYQQIGGGGGSSHGKDDIVCVLADIDQGVAVLSSRQLTVVELMKNGYQIKEICKILGISPITVNFHIRQAVFRLADFLNTSRREGVKR